MLTPRGDARPPPESRIVGCRPKLVLPIVHRSASFRFLQLNRVPDRARGDACLSTTRLRERSARMPRPKAWRMRSRVRVIVAFVSCLLAGRSLVAEAATYYVDPQSGNNANA